MAFVKSNIITAGLSGRLGDLVFRQCNGKTVAAKAPGKRKGDPTSAQAEIQKRFWLASLYARSVLKDKD